MKKIKIILFAMAFTVAFSSFAGCEEPPNGGEITEAIGRSDEPFRFYCYSTPQNAGGEYPWKNSPSRNNTENWQAVYDCGFNYALPVYDYTDEDIEATLSNAERFGIKVLVQDISASGLQNIVQGSKDSPKADVRAMIDSKSEALIARYQRWIDRYPNAFAGVQVFDEPSQSYFQAIAAAQEWWYEHFPEYELYSNLLPKYATYSQLHGNVGDGSMTYDDYVKNFINEVNPAFLSYDNYPYLRTTFSAAIRRDYLSNLESVATCAKKNKIPFYCYQLLIRHLNYTGPDTYREYAWQVYTALTYGCRGLQTFKYWAYMVADDDSLSRGKGLVDQEGNIQPIYYAVRDVNSEIRSFEDIYMAFGWEGTMPVGQTGDGAYASLSQPLASLHGVRSVTATEDAIIGQFKDKKGNKAFMVTNYSSPYSNKENEVTVTFKNVKKVLICKRGRQVIQNVENNVLKMKIGSGEGHFVVPVS